MSTPGIFQFTNPKFLPGVLVAAALLTVTLRLPQPYRDGLLAAFVVACAALALYQFPAVWLGVLTLLPLVRLGGELFQVNGVTLSRLLVGVLTLVCLYHYTRRGVLRALVRTNAIRWFGLFILVNLVSAAAVLSPSAVFTTLTYLEPFLLFALTFAVVQQRALTFEDVLRALLVGASLVAAASAYEFVTQQPVGALLNPAHKQMLETYMYGYDSNRFGLGGRISGLIAQPVYASLYWVLALCIAVYEFRTYAHARWWQGASIAAALFFLVLSGTRGGMLALAAAVGVWLWLGLRTMRQRLLVLGAVGAGAVLAALLLPGMIAYLGASLDLRGETIENRNVLWRIAVTGGLLQVFADHWLLGYGPGVVQKLSAAKQFPRVNGRYPLGGLENQYATILADGGIVAGLAYLLFMLGVVQDCARLLRAPAWRTRGVLLSALFAAYFVFAATGMSITEIPNLLLMAVYGALMAASLHETAPVVPVPAHD